MQNRADQSSGHAAVRRHAFPRRMRLAHAKEFAAVRNARVSRLVGPLMVSALPNDRRDTRLGLAVSTRVGPAVRRNRIKRLLREAFRLDQHDLPRGYDVVVSVRPHDALDLAGYRRALLQAVSGLDATWRKRLAARDGAEKP
jgi:ribonuclease P protein component